VTTGVMVQLAAAGLILIMLGAIVKKLFVWHSGFGGKHGTDGCVLPQLEMEKAFIR
jgi:hypothetical protein